MHLLHPSFPGLLKMANGQSGFNPMHMRLFGAQTEMPQPNGFTHLVE